AVDCPTRNPLDPAYTGANTGTTGIGLGANIYPNMWHLFEDCKSSNFFQAFGFTDYNKDDLSGGPAPTTSTWIIRRCIATRGLVDPNAIGNFRAQGMQGVMAYPSGSQCLFEENYLDSNGWNNDTGGALNPIIQNFSRHFGFASQNHNFYGAATVTATNNIDQL